MFTEVLQRHSDLASLRSQCGLSSLHCLSLTKSPLSWGRGTLVEASGIGSLLLRVMVCHQGLSLGLSPTYTGRGLASLSLLCLPEQTPSAGMVRAFCLYRNLLGLNPRPASTYSPGHCPPTGAKLSRSHQGRGQGQLSTCHHRAVLSGQRSHDGHSCRALGEIHKYALHKGLEETEGQTSAEEELASSDTLN